MTEEKKSVQGPTGIPHVAGTKLPAGKKLASGLFLIAAAITGIGGTFWAYQNNRKAESAASKEDSSKITSQRKLALPSAPPVLKKEVPAAEPVKEMPPPAPAAPTAAERKNASPLMPRQSAHAEKTVPHITPEKTAPARRGSGQLASLMEPVKTDAASARMLSDRSLTLAKGTFIDCVLNTRIDTSVPGMASCTVSRNVYSDNGRVLLIEKGSSVTGEYQGSVASGLERIFVLWTRIKTPEGVVISLDSPAAGALGEAGVSGQVDYHWWKRFGSALLFTLVEDAFDYASARAADSNGGVSYYANTEDGMDRIIEEAMRQSGNIPPTLIKNQGERLGIFVARDLYFGDVYDIFPQ